MKHTAIILAMLAAFGCKKEQPAQEVILGVGCFRCEVVYGRNGSFSIDTIGRDFPPDTSLQPFATREYNITSLIGDEVMITAHSLQQSDRMVMTYVFAGGRIQDNDMITPVGADSAMPSTARWNVVELDEWGWPRR